MAEYISYSMIANNEQIEAANTKTANICPHPAWELYNDIKGDELSNNQIEMRPNMAGIKITFVLPAGVDVSPILEWLPKGTLRQTNFEA